MTASVLPSRCERDPSAARVARSLAEDARQAAVEARALMSDLRPGASDLPLAQAVRERAEGLRRGPGSGRCARRHGRHPGASGRRRSTSSLRILGEALANAFRHGGATHVAVSLGHEGDGLVLRVADDGGGLPDGVDFDRLKAAGHFGLAGMDERARSIGGTLELTPSAGGGAIVTARVPVGAGAAPRGRRRAHPVRAGRQVGCHGGGGGAGGGPGPPGCAHDRVLIVDDNAVIRRGRGARCSRTRSTSSWSARRATAARRSASPARRRPTSCCSTCGCR